jgi:hypothetical protein
VLVTQMEILDRAEREENMRASNYVAFRVSTVFRCIHKRYLRRWAFRDTLIDVSVQFIYAQN